MGKMAKNNYQMITVKEYVNMLDNEVTYLDTDAKELKASVEKYLIKIRRAQTNAKILESLLGYQLLKIEAFIGLGENFHSVKIQKVSQKIKKT